MRRRERQQPEHGSPHEQRLREIVDMFVHDDNEKAAYLAFARDLMAAERHAPFGLVIPREQGDSRNLSANRSLRDPSISRGCATVGTSGVTGPMSKRPWPLPDFGRRTKRVVAKWFARGLHGNIMWRIGDAILNRG
jgi:hypothetical protein